MPALFPVHRQTVRSILIQHIPQERVAVLMQTFEPLCIMCEQNRFYYGSSPLSDESALRASIECVTNRPCITIELVAESVFPNRLMTTVQPTNIHTRMMLHLKNLRAHVTPSQQTGIHMIRYAFGSRLQTALPLNLWKQLWTYVEYWIVSEMVQKLFVKEACALECIVRACVNGYIPFDQKPADRFTIYMVNAKTAPPHARYRPH